MLKLKVPRRECVGATSEDINTVFEEQHINYMRRPVLEFLTKRDAAEEDQASALDPNVSHPDGCHISEGITTPTKRALWKRLRGQ